MTSHNLWRVCQRGTVVATLLVVGVLTLDHAARCTPLPDPANRFFAYYDALEETGDVSLWERVVYSWMLARG